MRLLQRLRPRVDVAQLVESSVERERPRPRPRLRNQIVRLVISRPHLGRRNSVAAGRIHRRAHREAGDQSSAAQAIEQREFLGDANRWIVKRQRVAEDHQRSIGFTPREDGRDHVRRNRKAVTILMMLVQAEAVEAEIVSHLQFVEIPMQVLGDLWRVAKLVVGRRHPDALVAIAKIIRQVAISLHVKPNCFHTPAPSLDVLSDLLSRPVFDWRAPARAAAARPCRYESSALATNPFGSNPIVSTRYSRSRVTMNAPLSIDQIAIVTPVAPRESANRRRSKARLTLPSNRRNTSPRILAPRSNARISDDRRSRFLIS